MTLLQVKDLKSYGMKTGFKDKNVYRERTVKKKKNKKTIIASL